MKHYLRTDISYALIHLTGKRRTTNAKDALISILSEVKIRASDNSGYIKGKHRAACFSEMPLSSLPAFVEYSIKTNHPYEYYGIALSKESGWERGTRPVIYLPDDEACWIPEEEKWRHVRFEYGKTDFSHEREWRSKGDFNLDDIGFYVIVPDFEQESEIRQKLTEIPLKNILGFLHMDILREFI
jgi:hypothetical protein